jgi:predicted nucleic acid-binding protein
VVDASVALKWFLRGRPVELHVSEAEAVAAAIGRGGTELFAPAHWMAEIVAVLARTEPDLVDEALVLLDDMRPIVVADVPVVRRAAELSTTLSHHLFDTLYHAVALEEGATLVTADETYCNKAKSLGGIVALADFSA